MSSIKEEEFGSIQRHHDAHRVSSLRTLFMLLKSFIGAGVLFLPNGFKDGGILFAAVTVMIMGYISLEAMWLLIDCQVYLEETAQQNSETDPVDLAKEVLAPSPETESELVVLETPACDINGCASDATTHESSDVTVYGETQSGHSIATQAAVPPFPALIMLEKGEAQFNLKGDFAKVGRTLVTARYGPRWGRVAEVAVDTTLTLSQFGFCATTFLFFAQNVHALIPFLSRGNIAAPPLWMLIFPQLCFYIPAALLKHLSYISFLAISANLLILLGLSSIFYYGTAHIHHEGIATDMRYVNPLSWHLFLGTIVYAFEGIGLVLPLRSSMRKPRQFSLLLGLTVLVTVVLMLTLSIVSYMAYGGRTQIIIFDSLPQSTYTMVLRLLYSFAMLFTVPMTMWPGLMTLEKYIVPYFRQKGKVQKHIARNAIRTLSPTAIAVLAWSFGSHLDILVSIVGSLCCGPLLFVFPAFFHFLVAKTRLAKIKDAIIALIGIGLTLFVALSVFPSLGITTVAHFF